jgi:hypothetical protein
MTPVLDEETEPQIQIAVPFYQVQGLASLIIAIYIALGADPVDNLLFHQISPLSRRVKTSLPDWGGSL